MKTHELSIGKNYKWSAPWKVWTISQRVAVREKKDNITTSHSYSDLYRQAKKNIQLVRENACQSPIIAVLLPKSFEWISWLWACDLMDACFVPIDPNLPEKRQQNYLNRIQPDVIVSSAGTSFPTRFDRHVTRPLSSSYLYFTSGSSGAPKAVICEARHLRFVISEQIKHFSIDPLYPMCSWWLLSVSFDASLSDIGVCLSSGGTLYINEQWKHPKTFIQTCEQEKISYIDAPPTWLSLLPSIPQTLQTIVCGGEVLTQQTITQIQRQHPSASLFNVYGPTEVAVCTSIEKIQPNREEQGIGQPLSHVTYLIDGKQAQNSQEGELWIQSHACSVGYLDQYELTQQRYDHINGVRVFKTRDRVQYQNGAWIFKGRLDRQCKIRGQLLNLSEVDFFAEQINGIEKAYAWNFDQSLHLAVFKHSSRQPDLKKSDILKFLRQHLPSWGVPNHVYFFETWPIGPNGKTNTQFIQQFIANKRSKI